MTQSMIGVSLSKLHTSRPRLHCKDVCACLSVCCLLVKHAYVISTLGSQKTALIMTTMRRAVIPGLLQIGEDSSENQTKASFTKQMAFL